MMELGLNFDDGDFVEEQKQKPVLTSYNAKICEYKWFLGPHSPDGKDDIATVCKFRADYHYSIGEYQQAVQCYEQSLDSLGSQNRTMRREILESLARCYIHMGDLVKALDYSNKMLGDCLTSAQFCQALLLQHQIHKSAGKVQDEIQVLHHLIHLHSFHHPFWIQLAQAYSKLIIQRQSVTEHDKLTGGCVFHSSSQSKRHLPPQGEVLHELGTLQTEIEQIDKSSVHKQEPGNRNSSTDKEELSCETDPQAASNSKHATCHCCSGERDFVQKTDVNGLSQRICDDSYNKETVEASYSNLDREKILSGHPLDLIKLTCLIRAKLILQCSLRSTGSFVNKRNIETLEKVGEDIQALTSDEHVLQTVTEFMRKDMFDDEFEDNKSKENEELQNGVMSSILAVDFNKRWFSWVYQL